MINFVMQVYMIEYLLGTSQVNEYTMSKKKQCIVRTSIVEKKITFAEHCCGTAPNNILRI